MATTRIRFFRNEFGVAASEPAHPDYGALGSMLTSDVQSDVTSCLDVLAWTEDVWHGPDDQNSWQGNSWRVVVDGQGVHLSDLYSDDWTGDYQFSEAHEIVLAYLAFIAPEGPALRTALNTWESEWKRSHPCRDHLG
ncbi:hypothetical protein ACFOY4_13855 [Actinomadura syzygii]|uniref:Uncharacterized protein n=1 Tax=Actinomadura syzygii TaxID=1427538 RepID=A0A5D0U891_9ACTN|nr:hypothetical protein [Actinomadura syzygii]TYC13990.1 hypothetical protein FXF65_20390 [Actinomadura syzygii]